MSDRHWCIKSYGTNECLKYWNHRVHKFPGKFPGKPENSGKIPVSREAQNPGKSTPLCVALMRLALFLNIKCFGGPSNRPPKSPFDGEKISPEIAQVETLGGQHHGLSILMVHFCLLLTLPSSPRHQRPSELIFGKPFADRLCHSWNVKSWCGASNMTSLVNFMT